VGSLIIVTFRSEMYRPVADRNDLIPLGSFKSFLEQVPCQHANPANRKILLRLSEAISGLLLALRRFVLGEERYWNRLSDRLGSTCRHTVSPDQLQDRPELIGSDSDSFNARTLCSVSVRSETIPANSKVPFLQPQGPVHKPDVSARSK
jgi:hypothetical protein